MMKSVEMDENMMEQVNGGYAKCEQYVYCDTCDTIIGLYSGSNKLIREHQALEHKMHVFIFKHFQA